MPGSAPHEMPTRTPGSIREIDAIRVRPVLPWPCRGARIIDFLVCRRGPRWRIRIDVRCDPQEAQSHFSDDFFRDLDDEAVFYLTRAGLPFEGIRRFCDIDPSPPEPAWQQSWTRGDRFTLSLTLPAAAADALDRLSAHRILALRAPREDCEILFNQ